MVGVGASVASLLGFGIAALAISGELGGAERGMAGVGLSVGGAFLVAALVGCLAGCLVILAAKAAYRFRRGQDAREVGGSSPSVDRAGPVLAFAAARRRGAVP